MLALPPGHTGAICRGHVWGIAPSALPFPSPKHPRAMLVYARSTSSLGWLVGWLGAWAGDRGDMGPLSQQLGASVEEAIQILRVAPSIFHINDVQYPFTLGSHKRRAQLKHEFVSF